MKRGMLAAAVTAFGLVAGLGRPAGAAQISGEMNFIIKNGDIDRAAAKPPTLTVSLTPIGPAYADTTWDSESRGGRERARPTGDRFPFEDGISKCVVRSTTRRTCRLSWTAPGATTVELSPGPSEDQSSVFSGSDGSITFSPYQFEKGEFRTFDLIARNASGRVTHRFTIRRIDGHGRLSEEALLGAASHLDWRDQARDASWSFRPSPAGR